ncbi:MAG TPA: hypothetical protein PLN95_03965 [Candidatus Saccharibacteria bacterium]|nr:hypothetical protein [Candidatus Saccharibacteria bacterium]
MTVETLNRPDTVDAFGERRHADADEIDHLLDVAATLAAMEEQFQEAKPDKLEELRARKDALIEELTSEHPGETLLNDVILLASVYHRRITSTRLPKDGSTVKAFGTRDPYNQYLKETYVLHEKPHGGYHYAVRRLVDRGSMLYELDDQAGLKITRQANPFVPALSRPMEIDPESDEYQIAVKELLGTTLTAMGALRGRDEAEKAKADMQALFMIEGSSFAAQFLEAESSGDVMRQVRALMTVEPQVMSKDALRLIVATTRR